MSGGLRDYLRGAPARPNPGPDDGDRADWRLDYLRLGEPYWRTLPGRWTRAAARDEMGAPTFEGGLGDLVALSAGDGGVHAVWVCGPSGFVEPSPLSEDFMDPEAGWFTAWHGPDTHAGVLLGMAVAARVDRRRVILALAGIVGVALGPAPRLPEGRRVLAAAVAWADGYGREGVVRATLADAQVAADRAAEGTAERDALRAAHRLGEAACLAADGDVSRREFARAVARAEGEAGVAIARADDADPRTGAGRAAVRAVREAVPLAVLLLARLGVSLGPGAAG